MTPRIPFTVCSVSLLALPFFLQERAYGQAGDFSSANDATRVEACEVADAQVVVRDAADDAWKMMAGDGCGGNGQVPCYRWSSCAWRDPIFNRCIPGFVLDGPYDGCDNDRLNYYVVVCSTCGRDWAPLCFHGPVCDPRHNPAGLCVPCGGRNEALCWSGEPCDLGTRINGLFCTQTGFSEEPDCDCSITTAPPQTPGEPVRGYADIHTHMFSNLAFGGAVFWGAPYDVRGINRALAWCDFTWDFSVNFAGVPILPVLHPTLGFMIHGGEIDQTIEYPFSASANSGEGVHSNDGTGPFHGWPKWNTTTHQQMYYRWLERAYKGGMRLFVMLAVNNEVLCRLARQRYGFNCGDMFAVDKQIEATKQLERHIDNLHGGPGRGWFRIAYSAAQAREIIEDGKLAVVLGIEVDAIFGCKPGNDDCDSDHIRRELQKYHNQGVRHLFPVHLFDNRFSGGALYTDTFTIANIIATNGLMLPWDCSSLPEEEDNKYNYKISYLDSILDFFAPLLEFIGLPDLGDVEAHCNLRGLSDEGRTAINAMMDQKMIVDIDHLSLLALEEVLDIAEGRDYPLVSGHTFLFNYPDATPHDNWRSENHKTSRHIRRLRDLGGIVAPLNPRQKCSSTRDYIDKYRYVVELMSGGPYHEEGFPGIAFATDWGGMYQQTAPRFGPDAEDCENYDADAPRLAYPFDAVGGFGRYWRQQTGQRTFDFNTDGLAHAGLLPDFFADLVALEDGLTEDELDPMFNSAETYIRMWERIDNRRVIPPPTIAAQVEGALGANGWYTSDVTVSWDVYAADPIVWHNECDSVSVLDDTAGITFTCQASTEGGQSQASVTIRRDTVPPFVTVTRVTPEPPSGWTNQPVIVAFDAADELSGIAGPPHAEVTMYREGADLTASHTFIDAAGLTTVAELGGINIDVTPPTMGFTFAKLPADATPEEFEEERLRWHNENVVFIPDAIDNLSGIGALSPPELVLSEEGAAVVGTVTAVDRAGNSITLLSPPVRIDKTPPGIEPVSRTPEPNIHGWNKDDITVAWNCQDALSGVVAAAVSQTLATEGENLSLTGLCADQAGNTTEHTVGGLNLDKTAPKILAVASPPANDAGWHNTDVTVTFRATDSLSGVDGADVWSTVLDDEGTDFSASHGFTDRAGNSASSAIGGINIDKTPPVVACTAAPAELWPPNQRMIPVTVSMTFTDELSGTAMFSLTTLECAAARTGLEVPDLTDDVEGFQLGSSELDGALRAKRAAKGQGRVYTLRYTGVDVADNTASCSTTVTVPPNRGRDSRLPAGVSSAGAKDGIRK